MCVFYYHNNNKYCRFSIDNNRETNVSNVKLDHELNHGIVQVLLLLLLLMFQNIRLVS
ncbi:hypothetical protein MtrunA17_Chr2g0285361 [Medicago truncatula]|uniref:Transmembrane protein n=1 Tax=Medicago truncatula TaxID=3880 RepID=A0A396J6N7_MEDTR|nr:hypothetical protein MtrunA17_Chr2g0285361 [Medicago truncatula]